MPGTCLTRFFPAHLGLAADPLADLSPARERIDDWGAFLDAGLDPFAQMVPGTCLAQNSPLYETDLAGFALFG